MSPALLSSSIGSCRSLQLLELYENRLLQVPSSIGQLTGLTELNLRENDINKLPKGACFACVWFPASGASNPFLAELSDCGELRVLDVVCNNLRKIPKVDNWGNLLRLDLRSNCLKVWPDGAWVQPSTELVI